MHRGASRKTEVEWALRRALLMKSRLRRNFSIERRSARFTPRLGALMPCRQR